MNVIDKFQNACGPKVGRTLLVGSKVHDGKKIDRRMLYGNAVGVDMEEGLGVDRVLDLEEPLPDDFGRFSHIECTSVLEHSRRPWLLAANLERALVDDGTILVMVPWVWRVHSYPSDYWRMTPAAIRSLFPNCEYSAQKYIVEGKLVDEVPKMNFNAVRWHARSELIMFGTKCNSTS
jgi:hypothetical protein